MSTIMILLQELTDKDVGGVQGFVKKRKLRKAARAVLFKEDGKIALLHVGVGGYYKLPGGGVDLGEDIPTALSREVEEEVGCKSERGDALGIVIEYRTKRELLQISYAYIATTKAKEFFPSFTQKEIDDQFSLVRVSIDEAIKLVGDANPSTYDGLFIKPRDLSILQQAKKQI